MILACVADESSGAGTALMHIFTSPLVIRKREVTHKKEINSTVTVKGMYQCLEFFREFQLFGAVVAKLLMGSFTNLVTALCNPVKCRQLA